MLALQMIGQYDMDWLIGIAKSWIRGNSCEKCAAVAAICEPELLWDPGHAKPIFEILDKVTEQFESGNTGRTSACECLRDALASCWSLAVTAYPEPGKPVMEKWIASTNPDIRWFMQQNLESEKLREVDAEWVSMMKMKLEANPVKELQSGN